MKKNLKVILLQSKSTQTYNSINNNVDASLGGMPEAIHDYLFVLLSDLEGVLQSAKYHPEGDTLYHSLQVFQCARAETNDPELLAAALFHDVGKAIDYPNHAAVGAELLSDILSPRVCWLIEHHLDLLISAKHCRRKYANTMQLADLEKLRRWDLAGREVDAKVMSVCHALDILEPYFSNIASPNIL